MATITGRGNKQIPTSRSIASFGAALNRQGHHLGGQWHLLHRLATVTFSSSALHRLAWKGRGGPCQDVCFVDFGGPRESKLSTPWPRSFKLDATLLSSLVCRTRRPLHSPLFFPVTFPVLYGCVLLIQSSSHTNLSSSLPTAAVELVPVPSSVSSCGGLSRAVVFLLSPPSLHTSQLH